MNRKAVFFDADGTLCDMEKGVPQSTKEALKKLRENGHDAWLCTGRSRAFVSWYLEELPFTGMISACGATIEKDGERLFNKEMPPDRIPNNSFTGRNFPPIFCPCFTIKSPYSSSCAGGIDGSV